MVPDMLFRFNVKKKTENKKHIKTFGRANLSEYGYWYKDLH